LIKIIEDIYDYILFTKGNKKSKMMRL
jgi:hypothetical protein